MRRKIPCGYVLFLVGIVLIAASGCTLVDNVSTTPSPERPVIDNPGDGPASSMDNTATEAPAETLIPPAESTGTDTPDMLFLEGHPRLFFNASEIPNLQAQAETTHREIWVPIRDFAHFMLGTSPSPSAPPDGDQDFYRDQGNQLIALAFACVIAEDEAYCDLVKTYLLTYASWEQWGEKNERGLGHAHMLLGNAIAYDWLYNKLTPEERQTVRNSLEKWTRRMYEASSQSYQDEWNNWWRKSYMQNHYWTANSALGVAGLALMDAPSEESEAAQAIEAWTWVSHAQAKLLIGKSILDSIEDGTWHESIPYQNYMLTMALPFWVNLRDLQGIDILPHSYLRNYPYWRLYNNLPNGQFILAYGNFEWSWSNGYAPQNVLRFAASEYDDGYAEWMAQQIIASEGRIARVWRAPWYVFEFLYYDATVASHPPTDLPGERVFPDLEGIIWRTGWDENALVFGFKTGGYGGRFAFDTFVQGLYPWEPPCNVTGCSLNTGHDHDDANTFYIFGGGRWLAPEFAEYAKYATEFHNAILIDGQGQYRPPDNHYGVYPEDFIGTDGFIEATASSQGFNFLVANATQRYRNIRGLKDVTRYVLFVRPDYFVMLDNLAADSPHQYEWVTHFGESALTEGNWIRGYAGYGQILGVAPISPQPFLATTAHDGSPYVRVQPISPVSDVRFVHVLYPTNDNLWNSRPDVSLLADNGNAAAVRVLMNEDGWVDDILIKYSQPGSTVSIGPYEYDGRVAVVSRRQDGELIRLFVYGGTFLSEQEAWGGTLISNLNAAEPFEVTYSGDSVAVYGNITTEITLYAPQAKHLTVNGIAQSFVRSGDYITF